VLNQTFFPCRSSIWQWEVWLSLPRSAWPNGFTLVFELP